MHPNHDKLLDLTTQIVAAELHSDRMPNDATTRIPEVYAALASCGQPEAAAPLEPAVPVKKSVTPDYLICLEDGKKLKILKRYLKAQFGMTPDEYRAKWGLPSDYPMVAENYSKRRTELAKEIGLGRK